MLEITVRKSKGCLQVSLQRFPRDVVGMVPLFNLLNLGLVFRFRLVLGLLLRTHCPRQSSQLGKRRQPWVMRIWGGGV